MLQAADFTVLTTNILVCALVQNTEAEQYWTRTVQGWGTSGKFLFEKWMLVRG